MKAIVQRVISASVDIDNKEIASINNGMLVLLGIHKNDTEKESDYIIKKFINLRIFSDANNLMNKSIVGAGGEILIVSQFTLYGSVRKGNRPSFTEAMPPKEAEVLYNKFIKQLKAKFPAVKTGNFGAYMKVQLINDGPVTILLDSQN